MLLEILVAAPAAAALTQPTPPAEPTPPAARLAPVQELHRRGQRRRRLDGPAAAPGGRPGAVRRCDPDVPEGTQLVGLHGSAGIGAGELAAGPEGRSPC